VLGGCATAPPGYVAREWSKTMRELGITPVFPPREDVQVGDIYMAPTTPEGEASALEAKGYVPLGLWVATADVSDALKTFYGARPSFPVTDKTNTAQPHSSASTVFDETDARRLRVVGFPVFMSATLTQGSLSGLIPTEAVSVAAAAGFMQARRVTVSVPRAESYGIPAAVLLGSLITGAASGQTKKQWNTARAGGFVARDVTFYLPSEQRTNLQSDPEWEAGHRYGYVRVITEVFYARELDVSIESSRGGGLSLDVRPAVTSAVTSVPPVPAPVNGTDSGASSGGGGGGGAAGAKPSESQVPKEGQAVTFSEPTPQEIAAALNKQLDAAKGGAAPGVGARFVTAGAQGIGMRVTFERPIAIGYRGVLVKLFEDGSVEGAGGLGSAVPTEKNPPGGISHKGDASTSISPPK